jgi:hypothetical protein
MKKSKKDARRLRSRIADHESLLKGGGDTVRKHPAGFTKPGSNKK